MFDYSIGWTLFVLVILLIFYRLTSSTRYLKGLDATFFNEDVALKNTIIGAFFINGDVPLEDMREVFASTVTKQVPELLSVIVRREWLWPYFNLDVNFNIMDHIIAEELPVKDSEECLSQLLSRLQNTPLHEHRPLWSMIIVPNYKNGSIVIFRFHHSLGDGVSGMHLMQVISFAMNDYASKKNSIVPSDDSSSNTSKMGDGEANNRERSGSYGWRMRRNLIVGNVIRPFKIIYRCFYVVYRSVVDIIGMLFMKSDSCSVIRPEGMTVSESRIIWSRHRSIDDFRSVSRAFDCSINDVILSCLSGSIARVMRENEKSDPKLKHLQCVFWVSLRPLDFHISRQDINEHGITMENFIGACYMRLPYIGYNEECVVKRLKACKVSATRLKNSMQPIMSFIVMTLFGYLPPILSRFLFRVSADKVTVSSSNVAGPKSELKYFGHELTNLLVITRPYARISTFLVVFSYNSKIQMALSHDTHMVPYGDALVQGFDGELDLLLNEAAKISKTS